MRAKLIKENMNFEKPSSEEEFRDNLFQINLNLEIPIEEEMFMDFVVNLFKKNKIKFKFDNKNQPVGSFDDHSIKLSGTKAQLIQVLWELHNDEELTEEKFEDINKRWNNFKDLDIFTETWDELDRMYTRIFIKESYKKILNK